MSNRYGVLLVVFLGVSWGCSSGGNTMLTLDGTSDTGAMDDAGDGVPTDACVPLCQGKSCGPDGCGGECGACGLNEECSADGTCACPNAVCNGICCGAGAACSFDLCCMPECEGLECGPDGCGGSCGECAQGEPCGKDGQCGCEFITCGPGCCSDGEVCVGDSKCCLPDCDGKVCGDDGCGGSCGTCGDAELCSAEGQCECEFVKCDDSCCAEGLVCVGEEVCCAPDCTGKVCGDDGCGGSCGECPKNHVCGEDFQCKCASDACGEACCGDEEVCTPVGCCVPQCEGKVCGDDACGQTCGECGLNETCGDDFSCHCEFLECGPACCGADEICLMGGGCCKPDCAGKECGSDGCGGSCGTCAALEQCDAQGACKCQFKECGGSCCKTGEVCAADKCCMPSCAGKECGDDGCGGSCGVCEAGCACGDGLCIGSCGPCVPSCTGKQCGYDGCGGTCGECVAGKSCDTKTWQCVSGACKLPTSFPGEGFKIVMMKMGKDGNAGEALDIDDNAATCSPAGMCSGGRDNQFGALMKSLAPALGGSEPIQAAVESGDIMFLLELVNPKTDGTPFLGNMYRGAPVKPKDQCDFQTQVCDYMVSPESFVPETCLPLTAFDNVQMSGNVITAGGPEYKFSFPMILAMTGNQEFTIPATHAKLMAELTFDANGKIIEINGVIGCAVPKAEIKKIIEDTPAGSLPLDKNLILQLIDLVVKSDIDANGDGIKESVSAGMKFKAIRGNIKGLAN